MIWVTPRRRTGLLALLLLGVLVLLTGQVRAPDRRAVGRLGHGVLAVLTPLQVALDEAAETGERWWRALAEIRELRAENARLRAEVEQLRRRLADLEEARSEVARLRRLLALRAELPTATLAARVVARDPDTWFATVLVNRGGRDGIRRHDVVVTAEGLVGRVLEVYPTASRVLLITDPRSAVGVLVQRTRDAAVVEGQAGPSLRLRYLPRDTAARPGDVLVTSGLGGVFPRGLRVGTIRSVFKGGLFLEAEVIPAADPSRIEEVLVLVGSGQAP